MDSASKTIEPNLLAALGSCACFDLRKASTSFALTPGFIRKRIALASFLPPLVITTLMPPDCMGPLALIEEEVIVSESFGSVGDAWTEPMDAQQAAAEAKAKTAAS